MRILIAEDDSILADGLTRSLRQSGYAVDHVKSGVEADTALSMQTFDLLILDLGLLKVLLQRVGRLVSKEQLVDHLCEWGEEVSNNAIEVYVHRLR
ncbi:winged helix-turn-helix domain-containing protein, partial [Burkholderia anthina]|uniref:winged helix-turn-helix domain-containing protein n=1 Tax=Burkholderia anthina TaxID=179879 RepID=UPI00158CE303